MTKHSYLITASTIALLASMATASISQSPGGAGSSGTEQQKTKPGDSESNRGTQQQERGTAEQPRGKGGSAQRDTEDRPRASDRAEEKASPKSRVQGQDGTPKASERAQDKASPKSAVQGQKKDDDDSRRSRAADDKGKDATKQQSEKGSAKDRDRAAGDASKDKDRDRSTGDTSKGKDRDRSAGDASKDKDRDRSAGDAAKDQRGDRDRSDRAGGDRQKGDRAGGDRADRGGDRMQLTEQKRTSVRERISKSARANRVTNVNFDIRVGARVPRDTTLHVLPPDVVEIVPEYRGYRYVYVRDEIVIIHPTDYEVVAVIGGEGRVGSRSGGRITLASDDRVFVRRHVDLGARVRLGIGSISIGMDLPDTVELRPLPDVVVQRYPDLRGHRYFVYEEDVVIVEPQSREVVLVIED
jgi:hypothetical protein